jgi:ketosteroid isomerase-like protein
MLPSASHNHARGGTEMNDDATRARIRHFAEAINTADMEVFDAIYHDDVVIEWPQSGEVIRGKKNIRQLRLAYPTPPTATLQRIAGSGDLWAIEMVFDYDGDRFHVIVFHQYSDGLVAHETSYYASPFQAPAWRAKWVEPVPNSASN